MTTFRMLSADTIEDPSGSTVQILGRTGLRVTLHGDTYTIDSEMLALPMSIVLYRNSVAPEAADRSPGVFQLAVDALTWAGFAVETI
ncbi:hypothetical protein ACF1AJ_16240 [Leifsonia sp. NPDC014704]|uniref:hypothetical protein n=1 Tax=Leifsonia sp. NPDC014704 TaxID=3364123 RepID=UPI0036F47744